MEKIKSLGREKIANILLIVTVFCLLMADWNVYSLYTKMESLNAKIAAVILVIILLLVCNVKDLLKDKWFYLVIVINVISVIDMSILKTGFYEIFPIFCITMVLYLSDKISFSKKEIIISSCLFAFFFFYWTFDVKGYFKGYSINYGGLVLISGFIFVFVIIEYLRYLIANYSGNNSVVLFINKYSYLITALELAMFLWAYNIISWYRSRTAFMALIAFAIMILLPRKLIGNKVAFNIFSVLVLAGGFLFPVVYIYIGNRVNAVDYQMFYKSLIDSRYPVWKDLFTIYSNYKMTGVGTIYTANDLYRPGLLDTMNTYLDLLVVYGPFVCAGTLLLIFRSLNKLNDKVRKNAFSKLFYVGIMVMLIASYAESMIMTVPFMIILFMTFAMSNGNLCEDEYKAIDFNKMKEMVNGEFGKKLLATALVVVLPVILILILGPVEIYYSNYDEFSFTNTDYLWIYLSLGFLVFFILTSILSVLPDKLNKVILSIILCLSVASYVQYMFLNKKLIMEDGEFIEAVDMGNYPLITLLIYIAIIIVIAVALIIMRKKIYDITSAIAGFLVIITLIATLSLFITHIGKHKETMWYSGVDQFKVAPNENVIVIVPDTFGRWALENMLTDYPDSIDFMNDFTFYEKEDSLYYPTYPALHHMLTAVPYDGTMTRYDYTEYALSADTTKNFFDTLHEKDYTVRLFTRDIFFEDLTQGMVDNIEEAHITIDRKSLFKFLFRMSMYRYVPYVVKGPFQVSTLDIDNINQYNGIGPYWLNSDFYPAMHEQSVTVDESIDNAFILHHIRGAHMPYLSNAQNELIPENSVKDSETAYGTMVLIKEYLDYLKAIDKYDDSTIIVVGDHGFNATDAIFFMKNKNEKHDDMIVSDKEIKHTDFQSIVLEAIK